MRRHLRSLALGSALAITGTFLLTACNRTESTPTTPAPPAISVGMEIDDTVATTRVRSALLGDPEVKGYVIKVETRKGTALLSGFVDSQKQIDQVMSLTRTVEGVKSVENGMTIKVGKASVGNTVDDSIVTAKVKSALIADPSIKSVDIGVVTRKGAVQLSGFVDSAAQMERASTVTRTVDGVQTVVSEMSLKK